MRKSVLCDRCGKPFDPESAGAIGDLATGDSTPSHKIPDATLEMDDRDWVGRVVLDESSRRKFTFLKPELEFYRRKKIAPPTRHFTWRMIDLLHESNLAVFEDVVCAKCARSIRVAKNIVYPNRTIYCKPCYLAYLEVNG